MVKFLSFKTQPLCQHTGFIQPKADKQGHWLKQMWKISCFQFNFHGHLFVEHSELTPAKLWVRTLLQWTAGLSMPSLPCLVPVTRTHSAPALSQLRQLQAPSWVIKKWDALHYMALTLIILPVILLNILSFSTTSIFSDSNRLLSQAECWICVRAWLAFSSSVQETKQASSKQSRSHRRLLTDYAC